MMNPPGSDPLHSRCAADRAPARANRPRANRHCVGRPNTAPGAGVQRRATAALAANEAQEKEFNNLFESAAIRKLSDEDTALRGRLDTVATRATAAAKVSKEVARQLEALKKVAAEELKTLRVLLG
ncbi:hypothetical protein [Luteimonas kalidii]|uniref:Uncharacterized protein n=1 Tax=Luteimonas kalidii TaxID=3042025 RepID=A0ABT6JT70_9GAMM|nr:hypothetical protein [Luteimonas kalidii]MDH5833697.1 hypothetical protein [Luteimonas kalidii]